MVLPFSKDMREGEKSTAWEFSEVFPTEMYQPNTEIHYSLLGV